MRLRNILHALDAILRQRLFNITTLLRRGGVHGRTQIARHKLDVFEGGGPFKCWQPFIVKLRLTCKISF